ncbi:hypothetical protein AB0M12_04695 [Nocardia vinacea]|uniref:hypothetical protein n=1 Tax=Nocardia vinacea TaxID=96468 RepID=UPI00341A5EFD
MFPIAYAQVRGAAPTPMSYDFPERRSAMAAAFPDFDGVTLQLADRVLVRPADRSLSGAYGSLAIGSYAKNVGFDYVTGYTPIDHAAFSALLCLAWDGSTCPDAYRRAFAIEPSTGRTIVDLMKVDRVVLQRAQYRDERDRPAPSGWKWVDYPGHERFIWVLQLIRSRYSIGNATDWTYRYFRAHRVRSAALRSLTVGECGAPGITTGFSAGTGDSPIQAAPMATYRFTLRDRRWRGTRWDGYPDVA